MERRVSSVSSTLRFSLKHSRVVCLLIEGRAVISREKYTFYMHIFYEGTWKEGELQEISTSLFTNCSSFSSSRSE